MSGNEGILIRKPGRVVKPGLGQVTRRGVATPEAPLTNTELAEQLKSVAHATCLEHRRARGAA